MDPFFNPTPAAACACRYVQPHKFRICIEIQREVRRERERGDMLDITTTKPQG
jgi:hypothetical protein